MGAFLSSFSGEKCDFPALYHDSGVRASVYAFYESAETGPFPFVSARCAQAQMRRVRVRYAGAGRILRSLSRMPVEDLRLYAGREAAGAGVI